MPLERPLPCVITMTALLLVVAACAPEVGVGSGVTLPDGPQLARGPAPAVPHLTYFFGETADAAITNDRAGDPYVDGACGAWGTLNTQTTSRDALLDPDKNYKQNMGACGPRFFQIEVRHGTAQVSANDGSYVTVGSVGTIRPGESQRQRVGFQLSRAGDQATGCAYVRYGYPGDLAGSDEALITNTAPVGTLAGSWTWTVESTGAHQPVCWTASGQKTLLRPMPFKLLISER